MGSLKDDDALQTGKTEEPSSAAGGEGMFSEKYGEHPAFFR
jgi:hypothetical protein